MKKLIIANWKMHPKTAREAAMLAKASDAPDVVVCPPYPFIPAVSRLLRSAALGAQNAVPGTVGPRTGEVSVGELRELGVRFVIVGHSERRAEGETDAQIAMKVLGVLEAGLTPILCVGEPLSVRKRGVAAAKAYVKKQLIADLSRLKSMKRRASNLLIAYEPVWAISTAKDHREETPEDAAAMATFIKRTVKTSVLYGGSVNARSAASFLVRREFSGALVGGASVRADEFKKIIAAAKR